MRYIIYIIFIIVFGIQLKGQAVSENIAGKVSFVSSQNIYVKFMSTEGISPGDTLFISSNGKMSPVLKVNNMSSVSCVCTAISGAKLSISQEIIARKRSNKSGPEKKVIDNVVKDIPVLTVAPDSAKKKSYSGKPKQLIKGSISAYSYSDFSTPAASNSTRLRYNLSIEARNIANSRFSLESYVSFRHKIGDWSEVKSNIFNALKIYNLAVRYDLNKSTRLSLGRMLNPKISSIGAMDGLNAEKSIGNFSVGLLAGSRPDYTDYGFNIKLLQYGAYLAYNSTNADKYNESSLAFMQQMNDMKTDRRFLYFQHSNSLIKNVYFYSTFEVDLYRLKSDSLNNYVSQNTFNLTGLYLSLRYRITKNLDVNGSYDARKNIVYYESFKTFIDRIIEDEMRQSFRLSVNYRITRDLIFGVQSGYRFLKTDPHPSRNVYSYLTYSRIPGLNMSVTINGTYLESNYLNSKIYGASLSRDFFLGKFYTGIGYRYVDYRFTESLLNTIQHIGEINMSWQFARTMSFSANYEGTFEKPNRYDRIYLQIRKRF
jgi:hypothetical protein